MYKKLWKAITNIILTIAMTLPIIPITAFAADSFIMAKNLTLNESFSSTIENESDVNYYKFTTSANDSFYKVELRNTEATSTIGLILYYGDDATTNYCSFIYSLSCIIKSTKK